MKKIVLIVVFIVVILGAGLLIRNRMQRPAPQPPIQAVKAVPHQAYLGLRNQALKASRTALKLAPVAKPTEPWGVLMDVSLLDGWASVLALSDGNPSLYLSNGFGYIGGGKREPIRKAGQSMVAMAAEFQPSAHAAADYPLPQAGQVIFYFLTDVGVFTVSAPQDDLANSRVPLSKLYLVGQEIATAYHPLQQQRGGPPANQSPTSQPPASGK